MSLFFSLPSRMEDLALFTRHVGGAMASRAPLPDILRAYVREAESGPLSRAIASIAERIEAGVSLSAALEEYPDLFPASYRRLVRLGEQGRALAPVMSQMAANLEDNLRSYEYFRRAAIYPLVLCLVLFADICFILITIVPKLKDIGLQLGMEMDAPIFGRMANIGTANFAQTALHGFGLLLLLPILFSLAVVLGLRVRGIGYGRFALQAPLIGPVLRRAETARFAGNLSLLLRNRIPLTEALGLLADSSTNSYVRDVIVDFRDRHQKGERLGDMMTAQPLFPPSMATMVAAAEDQGGLADTLGDLSRYYAERSSHGLAILREVFEPLMLILIGLMVGFILVSIYWPLFSITKVIPG